ncbi:hypothetical protein ACIRST_40520 [Kitasatospora sp. NPDC101447]|uniref:hypothetical protein n=1 Tax=Kitasatospora sp. NPDC101447 TaxID=3364102 RepID=UPI0038233D19
MGRPKKAIAEGAVAGHLAEFLQALCSRSGKTYAQMSEGTSPRLSVATLSRAASGHRRPGLDIVQAFARACGATPSEMRKAERLWRKTPANSTAARGQVSTDWREPELLSEAHQLGEQMRTALLLSGSPSLRAVEERAKGMGLSLSRSTLGDALQPGVVPTEQVFCVFMRVISQFDGSPAAGYPDAVWERLWMSLQAVGRMRGHERGAGAVGMRLRDGQAGTSARRIGGSRRRSSAPRAWVRPGPVREFKDFVHTLYLEAGWPSLADIAAAVRLDDSLDSAPTRDTVNRLLHSSALGLQVDAVAVAVVVARMAGVEPVTAGAQARELWIRAAAERPYGCAVAEADPLALGVREAVALADAEDVLPVLVPYVRRDHDEALDDVVRQAVEGHSAMVVARGRRATGKSRSCWEALQRLPRTWRLGYPTDPLDGEHVVEVLAQAGPRTVVWLDRIDRYLDPAQCAAAGRVHAEILDALHDQRRAPVLVVGTISATAALLDRARGSTGAVATAARTLVEDCAVNVPDRFTGDDLVSLTAAVGRDPRLALADVNATRGAVAQFLSARRNVHPLLKTRNLHTAVERGDTHTLHMAGALLQQSGRLEEAATWYQRAAEAGDPQALEPAARLLSENGEPYEAISWLRTLAEAGDVNAAVAAARRLLREGRDEEAVAIYQKAALADGNDHALREAVSLMQRNGRTEETVRWLRTVAAEGRPAALREAAHLLWEAGDRTRALRFYADAGEAGDLTGWRNAAEHLQGLGRDDEAIVMYRAAVYHGDRASMLPLADLLASTGRESEALSLYREAAGATPPDLMALWRLAVLYRTTERPDESLGCFRELSALGDSKASMQIGLILRDKCDSDRTLVDEAVAAFTKAADAGEGHAYREAVWLLCNHRGLHAAVAWLQHRVDARDRRAVREMGDLFREAGMQEKALTWYSRAAEAGSQYAAQRALHLEARAMRGGSGGDDDDLGPVGLGN